MLQNSVTEHAIERIILKWQPQNIRLTKHDAVALVMLGSYIDCGAEIHAHNVPARCKQVLRKRAGATPCLQDGIACGLLPTRLTQKAISIQRSAVRGVV